MSQEFILPKGDRTSRLKTIATFLDKRALTRAWRIEIFELRRSRSDAQNNYLWGVCYPTILTTGGESLGGWTNDDLHEFFLGEHFGWMLITGFGTKRKRPKRRSSKLSTTEFVDYVAFIQRYMAERGVYIPDPNEYLEAAA